MVTLSTSRFLSILTVFLHLFSLLPTITAQATTCNVCGESEDYAHDRVYSNWGLKCSELGEALELGLTCEDIQGLLGVYCGCPGATSACGVCAGGQAPPNPDLVIPLDSTVTTCGDIHLLASIYPETGCQSFLETYDVDIQSYCGCSDLPQADGNSTSFNDKKAEGDLSSCSFCPAGTAIGIPKMIPEGSEGATCEEMEELAGFVVESEYCNYVKGFAVDCCTESKAILPSWFESLLEEAP